MKTATVRELRNRYSILLRWIGGGEEIVITRRGKPVARLVPERGAHHRAVNWSTSPEVRRDRRREPRLSAKAAAAVRAESSGAW